MARGSEFKIGTGLKFRVDRIKQLDDTKVEAFGGYYEAELSASGCTYTLELKGKKWIVTKRVLNWIS